ncbi:MAG: EAL domain-containing protein [Myxococcales bacterium]|nr:EAL domain-containing protein [Myxococcales bacterium]MCB9581382.1 EAL domain-containing protein [Polyangiaceae bacterium]
MSGKRIRWTYSEEELSSRRPGDPRARSTRLITAEDLDIAMQPIVDLRSGRLFAVEALTRCKWPEYADPSKLFERAVEERACGRLGRPIREVAIARALGTRLFLNIHPEELSSRWLVRPDDPVNFHEGELYLEITESAAFQYFDLCKSVLKEVCNRTGAHLVVDDLGSGHSNLKRVLDLEPAVIKLDRELVRELHQYHRQQVLVRSVVKLCHDLGARVVAEGIETVDELSAVRDSGADFGQGYLLARPGYPPPDIYWPF